MLMALGGHLVGHRKIVTVEIAEIEAQFLKAVFEHVEEGRAPPALRCLADCGRTVLEYFALVALLVVPAEAAALKTRVQRVDDDHAAGNRDSLGAAALAKAAEQIVFGQTFQTLADQPVHQAQAGREFHGAIMPREGDRRKAFAVDFILCA